MTLLPPIRPYKRGPSTTQRGTARGTCANYLFWREPHCDVQLLDLIDRGFDGSDITVDAMGTQISLRLSIPGKGGVTNALAAIAAAMALDIDVSVIAQGIEALSPVEGRGNTLHLDRGIRLIDDSYNASPSSVMAALDSLKHARPPRTAILPTCWS